MTSVLSLHPFYLQKCFTQVIEFVFQDRVFLKVSTNLGFSVSNKNFAAK